MSAPPDPPDASVPEVTRRGERLLADLEARMAATEAQLEGLRAIRASVAFKAIPFTALVLAAVFGGLGWRAGDPEALVLGGIVIGLLVLFGVGSHVGIRRGVRRLAEIEAEYADAIRSLAGSASAGSHDERGPS